MPLIRCTAKLFKEIGVKDADLINDAPAESHHHLGAWYANLLRIDRRKCVLFTNEATLYSFMVYGVRKADLDDFGHFFMAYLGLNLEYEGFGDEIIEKVLKEDNQIGFGRTQSRSVLGSMNDLANQYWFYLKGHVDVSDFEMVQINQKINRTPMGPLGYAYGIEKLKAVLIR